MDFEITPEQQQLVDSVRVVLERECPTALVRDVVENGSAPEQPWKSARELGWASIDLSEEHGGLALGFATLGLVIEQHGRFIAPGPFLATVTGFLPLVLEAGSAAQRERFAARAGAGELTGALAIDHGRAAEHAPGDGLRARRDGGAWILEGQQRYVLDGDVADEIAVAACVDDGDGVGLFVVPQGAAKAQRVVALDASRPLAHLRFDGVRVEPDRVLGTPGGSARALGRALERATVAAALECVGTCQSLLELTLEHAKSRRQFDQPIGAFQALQHKCADMFVQVEKARATGYFAMMALAEDDPRRSLAASMAKTAASDCQQLVCKEGIQIHGGMGYTWESDVQLFVKRAKTLEAMFGTGGQHRQRIADLLELSSMQLHYDTDTEKFRAELRTWLEANQPTPEETRSEPVTSSAHLTGWARRWQRRLFDAGLLVPGWPPALGGRSLPPVQQLVYHEEMAKITAERTANPQGLGIIAPSILDYGSDLLKERYLLPTLRAEISWCLGMSEPGAGSDLAGLSTRAEVHDDHFVVSGQKIWTSGAHHADHCFCFVRTDPEAPKHRGISVVIIDMKAPGIRVRPLPELTDRSYADFNEVFFDGVVVPRDHLVGPLNHGWSISTGSLAHERGMMWLSSASRLDVTLERLFRLARERGPDGRRIGESPAFRDAVASLYVDAQAMWFMGYRGFAKFARGQVAPEHSVLKLFGSEIAQRAARVATEALGVDALDVAFQGWGHDETYGPAPWMTQYLHTFAGTIAAGASEIQRNIIAQRVLGLPRR